MNTLNPVDKKVNIFTNLMRVSNRLATVFEGKVDELTVKQWFMIIMLQLCESPPNLKELSYMCDSSYQNTKQIALKLQAKGLVKIEKDFYDGRAMRISVAKEAYSLWKGYDDISKYIFQVLFSDLSEKELSVTDKVLSDFYDKLEKLKTAV